MASMVTRSPTWPQRSVPPVLMLAGWVGAVADAETLVAAAAGLAAAWAWVAAGGAAGAGGAAAGPHAASKLAPPTESSSASAERRVNEWLGSIRTHPPECETVSRSVLDGARS